MHHACTMHMPCIHHAYVPRRSVCTISSCAMSPPTCAHPNPDPDPNPNPNPNPDPNPKPNPNFRKAKKTHEIERLAELIESVAGSAGCARVLDVGCGKGGLAARLSRGLDVVGVDAQADLTAAATAAAAALDGKVRVWQRT